jgi:hypothetical protein
MFHNLEQEEIANKIRANFNDIKNLLKERILTVKKMIFILEKVRKDI